MAEYLLNDHRIFDASDGLNGTAAFTARLDIDVEDTLEQESGSDHSFF